MTELLPFKYWHFSVTKFIALHLGINVINYRHFAVIYGTQLSCEEIFYVKIHEYKFSSVNVENIGSRPCTLSDVKQILRIFGQVLI
jgi:hypothetical protein